MARFNRALCVAVLLALGAVLAACKPGAGVTCPPLIPYSKAFQRAAMAELDAIKAPHLEQMLNDYGVTRDAIRACLKARDGKGRK